MVARCQPSASVCAYRIAGAAASTCLLLLLSAAVVDSFSLRHPCLEVVTTTMTTTTTTTVPFVRSPPSQRRRCGRRWGDAGARRRRRTVAPPPLHNAADEETALREEIARHNTNADVVQEQRYGVLDGEVMVLREDEEEADVDGGVDAALQLADHGDAGLDREIARLTKPRAYPLFLLEKAANVLDDAVHKFTAGRDEEMEGGFTYTPNGGTETPTKEKIVVLGTGWGGAAFLSEIDSTKFDVTVVSPRNFFLFTPMLAGASVGTVEYRSITEPVREINSKARYIEATATGVDTDMQVVKCESVVCEGNSCSIEDFELEYDRLILTVGAQTNTFGIPGVREFCCFLKQVEDAQRIRTAIVNCFERANFPHLSDEQKKKILTFAVIGAGPTGVEFASELRDFIEEDVPKYYPKLLRHVSIKIIEASTTVLAPFDESLQRAAIKALDRRVAIRDPEVADLLPSQFRFTELLLKSGVSEVKKEVICLNDGKEIPYGLAVWAAGNGPLPITLQVIEALGEGEQSAVQNVARGRVAIDPWLRALGGKGKVFAIGDCSCDTQNQLPATAQVASQQGEYLGRLFSQCDMDPVDKATGNLLPPVKDLSDREQTLAEMITSFATQSDKFAAPFQFLNLGILAYTGKGSALAQLQVAPSEKARLKGKGKVGFGLWRSVYLSKQISIRNRVLVALDWTKTRVFGRDITRMTE